MNLYLARILAIDLMKLHGLGGWSFSFDHARRRFGCCRPGKKQISLSRPLVLLNSEEEVRDTILHEIAHALTPRDGHGAKWKAVCRQIGARPVRCFQADEVITPARRPARWRIGCPSCGWWADRHRPVQRKLICKTCRTAVVIQPAMTA
jgi:predicted SprT family Zn-dependent metalloprotease